MAKISKKTKDIIDFLNNRYGTDIRCFLHFNKEKPYELLFATILSQQCTDERVNIVSEKLFKKYHTLESFAEADISELEEAVKSTGFYRNKAKNIKASAKTLIEEYNGVVPSDIEALTALPGVGRKTANVIRGNIYGIPSIVVDTHVKRISKRLGYTDSSDPEKVEFDLMEALPKEEWILWNLQIISFGRDICTARTPKCEACGIRRYCNEYKD